MAMADDAYTQSKTFDALNSRGLAGKREYVRSLEQRRDEEALSLLVECLCDESWFLRQLAEEALLRVGERATPVLLPLLEQGLWFTRTSAVRVLGLYGRRDAVPALVRLTEDANETVAAAARDSLAQIARGGGAIAVARALHALPPDLRRRRFDEISTKDRHLGERIDRMMRNDGLMSPEAGEELSDDSPLVRASEEGHNGGAHTGSAEERPPAPGSGRGEPPGP